VHVDDLELAPLRRHERADELEDAAIEHVDSGYGIGALWFGRLLLDCDDPLSVEHRNAEAAGVGDGLEQNARPGRLGAEALHIRRDAPLD
jgi:hypothetical protein